MEHLTTQDLAKAIQGSPQIPWIILWDTFMGLVLLAMVFAWVDIITFFGV